MTLLVTVPALFRRRGVFAENDADEQQKRFRYNDLHSSLMLREGARPEVVRDNMGHANIDVTQNVCGKSWWEERVDAVTRAVSAVATAAKAVDKESQTASA